MELRPDRRDQDSTYKNKWHIRIPGFLPHIDETILFIDVKLNAAILIHQQHEQSSSMPNHPGNPNETLVL